MRPLLAVVGCAACVFAGCLVGPINSSNRTIGGNVTGARLTGKVHGGQQPISGASVQLYAAGSTGYGSGALALLSNPVTTASDGSFSITNDYTCPSSSSLLYIVATGGNPGLAGGTNNSAIALAAALGPCNYGPSTSTLNPSQFIILNEVTTVAAVYALAQFWNPNSVSVGSSSTNVSGLANAFSIAATLADTSAGAADSVTPSGNSVVPQQNINTLANILAACVNTTGPSAASGDPCSTLFASVQPQNATAPADTISALLDIALSPNTNLSALFALSTPNAPFQPALSAAPADFGLAVSSIPSNITSLASLAIDSSGNAWFVGSTAIQGSTASNSALIEFSPTGDQLSGTSGYLNGSFLFGNSPGEIAIDSSDNIWALDFPSGGNSYISEFSKTGTPVGMSPYLVALGGSPLAVAISPNNLIWVALSGARGLNTALFQLNAAGVVQNGPTGFAFTAANPWHMALDSAGNAWVASNIQSTSNALFEYSPTGNLISTSSGYTGGGLYEPIVVAIDASGDVWALNEFNSGLPSGSLSEFDKNGNALSPSTGFTDSNYKQTEALAIDGSSYPWVASGAPNLIRVDPMGQTKIVLHAPSSAPVRQIAIDSAGTIWLDYLPGNYFLTRFIGAATPVATPVGRSGLFGARP